MPSRRPPHRGPRGGRGLRVIARHARVEFTEHDGGVRTEYRLTADGDLLERGGDHPAPDSAWEGARERWVVEVLPPDRERWHDAMIEALAETGLASEGEDALRRATDTVLAAHPNGSLSDDTVALRVALLSLDEGEDPVTSEIVHLVARHDRVLTAARDPRVIERLLARVRALPPARRRGTYVVARSLLTLALEHVTALSDAVTARTAALEEDVFSDSSSDTNVTRIYRLKRAIADARRHVLPVINRLTLVTDADADDRGDEGGDGGSDGDDGGSSSRLDAAALAHLERLEQGFRRVAEALETDDRLLGDMLTAQLTMVQVRQNTDMRKISAYAALAAVPTSITGIYGMNFDWMPELTWHWGYPTVLGVILVLVVGLQRLFKRSGWL